MRTKVRTSHIFAWILEAGLVLCSSRQAVAQQAVPRQRNGAGVASAAQSPAVLFGEGQAALKEGNLEAAEVAFRRVLAVDPASGGAY